MDHFTEKAAFFMKLTTKEAAAEEGEPDWSERNRMFMRHGQRGPEGLDSILAKPEIVQARRQAMLKPMLMGTGLGGLAGAGIGAGIGALAHEPGLGALYGAAIGAPQGMLGGGLYGIHQADKRTMAQVGMEPGFWGPKVTDPALAAHLRDSAQPKEATCSPVRAALLELQKEAAVGAAIGAGVGALAGGGLAYNAARPRAGGKSKDQIDHENERRSQENKAQNEGKEHNPSWWARKKQEGADWASEHPKATAGIGAVPGAAAGAFTGHTFETLMKGLADKRVHRAAIHNI